MEQRLRIPVTFGLNHDQVVAFLEFQDSDQARDIIDMWKNDELQLSPTVLSGHFDPDDVLKETSIIPSANFALVLENDEVFRFRLTDGDETY